LEAALEGLVAKLKRQAGDEGPEIRMTCSDLGEVSEPLAICLFRLVQESINNVLRHAGASMTRVIIERSHDQIKLRIADNGSGFQVPEDLKELTHRERYGLAGLKERVELAEGTLSIISYKGHGTTLEAFLPAGPRGDE
jgi:signal transduction histidine kinase